MDTFESDVQLFESTIYGSEMRESLGRCFRFLYDSIETYSQKIAEINKKINSLGSEDQNGVYR